MAYCHECGSEIGENDIFCPYCGISLQPIKVSAEVSPGNALVEQQEIAFTRPENVKAENLESFGDNNSAAGNTDNYATGAAVEGYAVKTESVEIPQTDAQLDGGDKEVADIHEPENIEILKPIDESLPFQKEKQEAAASAPVGEKAEIAVRDAVNSLEEKPKIVSNIGEKEKIAETQNESSIMNYAEAEVKEGRDFEEAELPREIVSTENEEEVDFTATIPYIPKDLEKIENSAAIGSEVKTPPAPSSKQKEVKSENLFNAPIAKPAAELELPVEESPPSKFDSVRIFEKAKDRKEQPREKDQKEKLQETELPVNTPSENKQQEPIEGRSYTTPNIGGTDTDGKKSAKLKPLDEGTILNGRYEIVRKIGGGGMGAVYLASDKNLGGVLRAVKEMVQSYIEGEQQEKAVNDFKRESLLLTSLEHQSIPTIYDYFYDEKEGRFYLVMKYISGGDLASRLRSAPEGRIEERLVTEWAIQIADVLDYLHNRQPPIVYRDLKPANIMIDGNSGRTMLIDFGIARWVNKEEKGVTAVGTMGYAPPELFSGNVEPRSDIYSLGSTMFHLLTGADPQSNPLLIFDFQKNPRPRQINPQLSDQMERILMRAVEYNADKRFASAAELRDALQEHLLKLKGNKTTFGVRDVPASVSLSEQPVFCGFCGQRIVATDLFCAFCGSKQPLAQQGVRTAGYAPAPLTAQLLIVGTNELQVPAFRIEKEDNLVGRRDPMSNIFPEVDLSKFDPQTKISRRHARIWRQGNEYLVEDLGSSNGTVVMPVVNETVRLQPHQPFVLANGDKLRLGDTTLHFVLS